MKQFFISLSFTKKYLFALSFIAVLSISAYINLSMLINSQADDGEVINISGRQRMLSQKIALYSLNFKPKTLKSIIALMENSHKKLISRKMSDEIKKLYFSEPVNLSAHVDEYLVNAKSYLLKKDPKSLQYILKNSQSLLKHLDAAVSIYQHESEDKITKLKDNEKYILILTLVTLVLEAMLIFRPINISVLNKTKALEEQKEYSEMVTNANTNAIIAVNEKFEILTFNSSAQSMFGYSFDEMINTTLLDERIIPSKYLKDHVAGIKNFVKTGTLKHGSVVFELEAQNKNKEVFPIRISFGIKIEGTTRIVVANIQNITNEKEKDALIMEQSRFAAMGEMIGNIAHQWRQPLSSISTIASGAKLRYKNNLLSDEELDDSFVKIQEHTKHLSKTIDDFRDFLKHDKLQELFDVCDVVKRSLMLTEAAYKDNDIVLKQNTNDEKLMLMGSASELSQVFLNILNNSKDALVEKVSNNRLVVIDIFGDDENIIIKIYDNALGINEDVIDRIFDPYFTTKHKSQGTGIGLFMSKKIITQKFNGKIFVENKEFELDGEKYYGAEFTMKFKKVKV